MKVVSRWWIESGGGGVDCKSIMRRRKQGRIGKEGDERREGEDNKKMKEKK